MAAVKAYQLAGNGKRGVILCCREFQNSLEESSMTEVRLAIESVPWLHAAFDLGDRYIRTADRNIEFIFTGLRHNLSSIKSKAHIHIAWIDEAESVSEAAWRTLLPTVREPGSEVWITWNPEKDGSPTDDRWRKSPPEGAIVAEVNFSDNPWFPEVLEMERKADRARLHDAIYAHVWEGAYLQNSNAHILAGKYAIEEFTPGQDWNGPFQGLDWGFAQDPTAAVRCWINGDILYIEHEAGKVGLEIDQTAQYVNMKIPDFDKYITRADNARPESISYVKRNGLPKACAVEKWPGSVEDGIAYMRSFKKIIIHPRCTETIKEARLYSYKVDRLSGDVLPSIIDAYNHFIDAVRYALSPMIRKRNAQPTIIASYR